MYVAQVISVAVVGSADVGDCGGAVVVILLGCVSQERYCQRLHDLLQVHRTQPFIGGPPPLQQYPITDTTRTVPHVSYLISVFQRIYDSKAEFYRCHLQTIDGEKISVDGTYKAATLGAYMNLYGCLCQTVTRRQLFPWWLNKMNY